MLMDLPLRVRSGWSLGEDCRTSCSGSCCCVHLDHRGVLAFCKSVRDLGQSTIIVNDGSIKVLWKRGDLSVFSMLVFCSVGWLILLYEPILELNLEALQVTKSPYPYFQRPFEIQTGIPFHILLSDLGIRLPDRYSTLPFNGSTLNPILLRKRMFKTDLNLNRRIQ
jgi:hypothetical protein